MDFAALAWVAESGGSSAVHPEGLGPLHFDEPHRRIDAKARRDPLQVVERDVPLAALHTPHVRPIHLDLERERLLAEALLGSQPADVVRDDGAEPTWNGWLDGRMVV